MSIISPMQQGNFEKDIQIESDAATVIHPLIEKVERAKNEPAGLRRYFITDHLQWGPFKFKIKYRADIIAVTEDIIHTEAYQSPHTFVTNVTKGLLATQRFVLSAVFVYQLAILYCFLHNLDLRIDLKALLKAP